VRRLLAGIAIGLLVLVGAVLVYLRLFAGGPVPVLPGGALRGELATEPVEDWSFAWRWHSVDVESRVGLLPYSRSCWYAVHEGAFYLLLPRLFGEGLQERIEQDRRLRIRLGGRVYTVLAEPVTDPARIGPLLAPMLRRQSAIEIEGAVREMPASQRLAEAKIHIHRLVSR
jgi:hypothetical protein